MKISFKSHQAINPTELDNPADFFSFLESLTSCPPYFPQKTGENQKIELCFTHPMVSFTKPERKSKHTDKIKPEQRYVAVYEPEPIGKGHYGSVHPVLGVWKSINGQWFFKTKKNNKARVLKTNYFKSSNKSFADEIEETYIEEQKIGKWIPHMGYDYQSFRYNNDSFLLMRQQYGISLKEFIKTLKTDPNRISKTDRLKITVNLIRALHDQVNSIKSEDKSYIIHRDIKPENILIDEHFNIHIIDYGLATTSSIKPCGDQCGTPIYMDPLIIANFLKVPSKSSDLASLGRVIAELWGDISNDQQMTIWALRTRNRLNLFTNLFHGISGLSNKDKKNIERIIIEMLDFDESKRMPGEELQIELELLLKQSEKEDNILNQKNAREKAIEELSAAELLSIFNSPHADNLIERIKMRPGSWQLIFNQLTLSQLLTLSEVRLLTLKENGLDFKLHCITSESIEKNNLNFKQLETLIKLGFSLSANTLTEWITTTNIKKDQEYPWASICRVLYQNSPEERESIRFDKKNESDFKSTFWQSCLMNEDSSSDDKLNCRLIKRHLELWNNYDFKINHEINKYHENTAYGKGLKLLISQYKQILLLSENIYMDKIYVLLKEFNYMKQLLIHTKPEAAENKAILMQIALFDEELLPMPDNKKQDFEQTLISTIRNYTEDLEKKIIKFKEIINAKSSQQNSYPGTFFGDNGNLINQDSQPCSSTLSP